MTRAMLYLALVAGFVSSLLGIGMIVHMNYVYIADELTQGAMFKSYWLESLISIACVCVGGLSISWAKDMLENER